MNEFDAGLEKREFQIWSNVFTRTAIRRLIENGAGFRKDNNGTKLVSKRTTKKICLDPMSPSNVEKGKSQTWSHLSMHPALCIKGEPTLIT